MSKFRMIKPWYLLVTFICLTAQYAFSAITFGPEDEVRYTGYSTAKRQLIIKAEGMATLNKVSILRRTGGGILQGQAHPAESSFKSLILDYASDRPDGQRLVVNIDSHLCNVKLFDWELLPIVDFAASPYHGTVSATEAMTSDELQQYGTRARVVSYHSAFHDNLVGLRLLQADYVRQMGSQKFLPREDGKIIFGKGETQLLSSAFEASQAERRLSDTFDQMLNHWILLTDIGVDFAFSSYSNQLVITGEPYYYVWSPSQGHWSPNAGIENVGGEVLPQPELSATVRHSWNDLYMLNPPVFKVVLDTARFAAFFRFAKENDPKNWESFQTKVHKFAKAPYFETPTIMKPEL